jgi:hypothetical protein
MTPAQELDSLPRSEAPARPGIRARPISLPNWKRCEIHRDPFLFECRLCAGAILRYGL